MVIQLLYSMNDTLCTFIIQNHFTPNHRLIQKIRCENEDERVQFGFDYDILYHIVLRQYIDTWQQKLSEKNILLLLSLSKIIYTLLNNLTLILILLFYQQTSPYYNTFG